MNRRNFIVLGGAALTAGGMKVRAQETDSARSATASGSARGVLTRLLGGRADDFDLTWIPLHEGHEVYEISASHGRIHLKGSSGVALCRGAYSYLREACDAMVTWSGQNLNLPAKFPDFREQRVVCPYEYVQYYNPCTFGYSTPFWNWERWQREIDWMALHGITMALALEGQEAIWQRIWLRMGITQEELDHSSTGPAYLPWHRMGNLDNFVGPLPQGWIDKKRLLQKSIIGRMRDLGIAPVVPGFSGFVPQGLKRVLPQAKTYTGLWNSQVPR
ncbi:MAG: alpha-N-acetylglucosaminidase TIM-barrel domain-containing protein, partial [Acidobacteriaceae bacterium]